MTQFIIISIGRLLLLLRINLGTLFSTASNSWSGMSSFSSSILILTFWQVFDCLALSSSLFVEST